MYLFYEDDCQEYFIFIVTAQILGGEVWVRCGCDSSITKKFMFLKLISQGHSGVQIVICPNRTCLQDKNSINIDCITPKQNVVKL